MNNGYELEEIFKAKALPINKLLSNDSSCFSIPDFQRRFSWDQNSINRFFDDIQEAIFTLKKDPQNLIFLGSVLFEEKKSEGLDNNVFSVVDGQQRLSTIIITTSILHHMLTTIGRKLNDSLSDNACAGLEAFRNEVVVRLLKRLRACFNGVFDQHETGLANQYPKLLRDDEDVLSDKAGKQKYNSPIAKYLYDYIGHVEAGKGHDFTLDQTENSPDYQRFCENYSVILKRLDSPGITEEDIQSLDHKAAGNLISDSAYSRALFGKLKISKASIDRSLAHLGGDSDSARTYIYLAAIASFLLDRVAVTRVVARNDSHVFDIFEALNSTGEPLTAFETLRPLVSEFENQKAGQTGGYSGSKSKYVFTELDNYLDGMASAKSKQNKSANLVIDLSLLVEGRKQSAHLASQRRYLRSLFQETSTVKRKRDLIAMTGVLIDFHQKFWDSDQISYQLINEAERESVLMCLNFIHSMNTTMAIPILTRFYDAYLKDNTKNFSEFNTAVKATAAFLAVWRAAYGGTNQIDSAFRELMAGGGRSVKASKAQCLSSKIGRSAPSSKILRQNYRALLKTKKLDGYKKWENLVVRAQLGKGARNVAKFLIYLSSHSTTITPTSGLMKDCAPTMDNDYLRLHKWCDETMKTVEHIAPVTQPKTGWDNDIYAKDLVQTVGNLTLLPEKENCAFGNKSWKNKKLLYVAFSCEEHKDREEAIATARNAGFTITERMKDSIRNGQALPAVKAISCRKDWTPNVIMSRSRNIAKLGWRVLDKWLDPTS